MPVYRVKHLILREWTAECFELWWCLHIETDACTYLAWRTIKPSVQQPQPDNNFISFRWNTGLWCLIIVMHNENGRLLVYFSTYGNALPETCLNYSVNYSDFFLSLSNLIMLLFSRNTCFTLEKVIVAVPNLSTWVWHNTNNKIWIYFYFCFITDMWKSA